MKPHYALQVLFRLPDGLARLLQLLIEQPVVSQDMIEHEHQLATQASVAVFRLRRRLAPYKIDVKVQRSLGYYIEHEQKIAITDAVKRLDVAMGPLAA